MYNDILYWNANGLANRFNDLESLLTQPQPDHHIAAVAIVESKLGRDTRDRPPSIDGYTATSIPFTKHSGGILFLISNKIASRHLMALDYSHPHSPTAVSCMLMQLPISNRPTLLIAVYIHPQATINTLTAVLHHMSNVVQQHKAHNVIIVGDFNSRHPAWGDTCTSRTAPRILDFLSNNNMSTLNQIYIPSIPTRPSSGTIIDLIITNRCCCVSNIRIADDLNLRSDHQPLLTSLSHNSDMRTLSPLAPTTVPPRIQWHTNNVNWKRFTDTLSTRLTAWNAVELVALTEDKSAQSVINDRYNDLVAIIIATARTTVSTRRQYATYTRWWSYPDIDMNGLHRRLRAAIRQYMRGGRRPIHYMLLVSTRREWRNAYKAAHIWEWTERCEQIESRPHKLSWAHWRRSQSTTRHQNLNSVVDEHGKLPLSTHESLNNLAQSLVKCSIPPHESPLQSAIEQYVQISAQQYSDDLSVDSVQWSCTVDDVGTACESVDTTGAQGCDDIHPAFIKHGGRPLHQALHTLYEYSYRHAVIPSLWTKAIISPIYKSGDPSSADSYRPISVTCMAVRIMERLIHPRLMSFVDRQIHPHQYGFRSNHSTQHAIYHLLHDIRQSLRLKPKLSMPVAFIDLTKAFDRVWRDGLLYQLVQKGITGRMWRWLRAFLSNRHISIASQQSTSDWFPQYYVVPQGAVLSPLLFSIFIDSCARMMNATNITRHPNATLLLFADDGAVYPNIHDKHSDNTMQTCLDVLSAWALLWKQQISLKKTVLVEFQRTRIQPQPISSSVQIATQSNITRRNQHTKTPVLQISGPAPRR